MISSIDRRKLVLCGVGWTALLAAPRTAIAQPAAPAGAAPDPRWYAAAVEMKSLAQSWGDQPYGAVLVLNHQLIGHGPSRVVQRADPGAHAEREAIRDAQQRLQRFNVEGSILYSTSRPCAACESAAAQARVSRMIFGEALNDAGAPRR